MLEMGNTVGVVRALRVFSSGGERTVWVVSHVAISVVIRALCLVLSLVPSVRIVSMVRVVPRSVPARIVSVDTVEVVSFSLLGLVLIRDGNCLIGLSLVVAVRVISVV